MVQATLSVTVPDRVWLGAASTAHPETTFEVLAAVPTASGGFALVTVTSPDAEAVLETVADHPTLTSLSVIQSTDREATIHLESTQPLLGSAKDGGLPIEYPVEIVDGEATLAITGTRERLSALVDHLESEGLRYRVESVRDERPTSQLLSDRQRELLFAAVERGYYDTPRECTLTDLAAAEGIAKSTCSETLHRAEEVVITEFVTTLSRAGLERTAAE